MTTFEYKPRIFNLAGLKGISDEAMSMHLELYHGYVKNTNLLIERLDEITFGKSGSAGNPFYPELKRRLGFEYGEMILHELYFSRLSPGGKSEPSQALLRGIEKSFGSFENWQSDFRKGGLLGGIGWAILYQDPESGRFSNHWVTLHNQDVPPSWRPVLAMDMWEHALLWDYKPEEKDRYIESFFLNINWEAVNQGIVEKTPVSSGEAAEAFLSEFGRFGKTEDRS